ncbi:hypothetical protein MMC28_011762 [Mycoblastus sanguinarius]|nr:hypothetical protein [Mycoblastus sanguinarius]
MKKPKIEDLLMARLFPLKKDIDPRDWQTHVRRNLVPEVQAETRCFYGNQGQMTCLEAQYPGLDYAEPNHRLRLSRFVCHRRLFRAFDELRLTGPEIHKLCTWQGTRCMKENFEVTNTVKIEDSTWEDIEDCRDLKPTVTVARLLSGGGLEVEAAQSTENEIDSEEEGEDEEMEQLEEEEEEEEDDLSEEESEDELQQSVGVELNQRLLAATEARARGEDATLDADWEQWLKEAAERGAFHEALHVHGSVPAHTLQIPVHWGRQMPEYLSETPASEIAALQARLPPPPPYFPLAQSTTALATTSSAPASAPPSAPHAGAAA